MRAAGVVLVDFEGEALSLHLDSTCEAIFSASQGFPVLY